MSLVNPEREIQPFVVKLTGINNKMLRYAPKFYELAKRIIEITEDCILVAHNANFDYRILKTEFDRLGFIFKRKTLCTVELSQELLPGLPSYSLGKLARTLGIPVTDRHRANGDALATLKLFKLLMAKDVSKKIIKDAVRVEQKSSLTPNLKSIVEDLPSVTGVYYIHNKNGEIIYIGKSRNIKKRINQHFTGKNSKAKKIKALVHSVSYEKTGSELMALLKENEEIKRNKPQLNHALKRDIFTHGLFCFTDENGYQNLKLEKIKSDIKYLTTFVNYASGKSFLQRATEDYELCPKLIGLSTSKTSCFNYDINQCLGACVQQEDANAYNKKVNALISRYSYDHKNIIITDKGRDVGEKSVFMIQNGVFIGMGYIDLNYQISNKEVLLSLITQVEENRDSKHIIHSFLRKHKHLKIIDLKP